MKKIAVIMVIILLPCIAVWFLTGCGNKDLWDAVYTFDRAIIALPNGEVIDGKVESWTDYEDSDQIQVKIDGTIYLVHSSNIILINDK